MTTFAQFAADHEVTMTAEFKGKHIDKTRPTESAGAGWEHYLWVCTVDYNGRKYAVDFRMGLGNARSVVIGGQGGVSRQEIVAYAKEQGAPIEWGPGMGGRREPDGRTATTAHVAKAPTLDMVLSSLASDANAYLNADGFEGFCEDFGYDTDSRAAERTYNACKDVFLELTKLFGGDFGNELLACTEEG